MPHHIILRGRPKLSSFSREDTEYAMVRGSMVTVRFFLNVDYDAFHLHTVVKNQHFESTLLGGRGGSQKIVLCVCF